jgi:tRNA pseudouridine55 synthase
VFGFINVNKPIHQTSRWAVNAVQKCVKPSRIGHAGTLDPLATGVLVLCIGPATRLTKYVQAMPKTYVADFRLGVESDSEDILGVIQPVVDAAEVTADDIVAALPSFVGEIMQMPPKFSALMVNGKRAYDLARAGKEVKLAPRPVQIFELELLSFSYPDFRVLIRCGSGTYVRSLGRDLGRQVGSGAIMTGLERTAIGNFKVENGISLEGLDRETIEHSLVKPQDAISELPIVRVPDTQLEKFVDGHAWQIEPAPEFEEAMAIDESLRLLTILKQRARGHFTPVLNFSKYWVEPDA